MTYTHVRRLLSDCRPPQRPATAGSDEPAAIRKRTTSQTPRTRTLSAWLLARSFCCGGQCWRRALLFSARTFESLGIRPPSARAGGTHCVRRIRQWAHFQTQSQIEHLDRRVPRSGPGAPRCLRYMLEQTSALFAARTAEPCPCATLRDVGQSRTRSSPDHARNATSTLHPLGGRPRHSHPRPSSSLPRCTETGP